MTSTTAPTSNLAPFAPQITRYQQWLADTRGLHFDNYDALWRWSTTDLDAYWQSIWDYFDIQSETPHTAVLAHNVMPGAKWFPGATINYAQQALRHQAAADAAGCAALVCDDERGHRRVLTWSDLQLQVAALATHLKAQGVQPGDRVVAYLPNTPEAAVALLAVASIGAVWSICSPDMGDKAVLDRFAQIAPKAFIACQGVFYAGKSLNRQQVVENLIKNLPTLAHVVWVDALGDGLKTLALEPRCTQASWASVMQRTATDMESLRAFKPLSVPFDHPIWVVYSSGTTGLPKPIVHGHGGAMMSALALLNIQNDVGCSFDPNSRGECFHWYSSTGWVMWNLQVAGLLIGTTCAVFNGSPSGSKDAPDWGVLFRFAARERLTFFGAGAAFYSNAMKAGLSVADCGDLSALRTWGSTGSPLSADTQAWGHESMAAVYAAAGRPDQQLWWCNISGGTDFVGAFVGGNRTLPLHAGQMQCRLLGCAVEAFDAEGAPLVDAVGELVCTQPLPSMPLYFWGDPDGVRYHDSYFDTYQPGVGRALGGGDAPASAGAVWRHGDWLRITPDGQCVIYGRSDATINRHGLRLGTSEIYSAVEALPMVLDSMVVDLEYLGRNSNLILFVVLAPQHALDDATRAEIMNAIRVGVSPRFLPDQVVHAPEIPRTLTGKKQELPIKKLLLGQPAVKVLNPDAMANPHCLAWYQAFASGLSG